MIWDAIIIGGGVHGLSSALQLARLGRRVLVLEQARVGAHASGASAGGVRRLGRNFVEVPLALSALDMWHGIERLVGEDCGFRRVGQVKIAESAAEFAVLEARAAEMARRGWDHEELVGANELRRLVPAVAPHCTGALVCRDDGFAHPFRTTLAFRRAAEAAGASVREGARVIGIDRAATGDLIVHLADGGRETAPVLVNCAGAWGARVAGAVGDRVPLGFAALMMMLTSKLPLFLTQVAGATGRPLSFKQLDSGHVMIGGGHRGVGDLDTGETALDLPRLAYSAKTAVEIFPALAGADIVHMWAGIEGMMPDDLPVIGPSPSAPAVIHAFGFCGHGFALAPIVGQIVAELARDGASRLPLAAFAADRFATAVG